MRAQGGLKELPGPRFKLAGTGTDQALTSEFFIPALRYVLGPWNTGTDPDQIRPIEPQTFLLSMAKYKRRIKLIKPRLQIRLTVIFFGLAALALVMQFTLFMATISKISLVLPEDGDLLMNEMSAAFYYVIGMSTLAILPLTVLVGIMATFRIAGPLYRMEMHLKRIIAGESPGPCSIRKGDDLQDFVRLLNEAATVLEARAPEDQDDHGEGGPIEKAA